MSKLDKDIRTLDMLTAEAAFAAMDEAPSNPDDRRWARDVVSNAQTRVAEMRRNLLPAEAPIKKADPLRPSLLAMGRHALEALFGRLTQTWGPQLEYAHRDLDTLSDNDLRRLIQTIDPNATAE